MMTITPLSAFDYNEFLCLKCHSIRGPFLKATGPEGVMTCGHTFCIDCFKNKNQSVLSFLCPCCSRQCYKHCPSFDEAILFGEGGFLQHNALDDDDLTIITNFPALLLAIDKFESALQLYPNNIVILSFTIKSYTVLFQFYYDKLADFSNQVENDNFVENTAKYNLYSNKIYNYCNKVIDICNDPTTTNAITLVDMEGYYIMLATLFDVENNNTYYALKYYKLAYEYCIRHNRTALTTCKDSYLATKARFDQEPKLRFKVGDTVEFTNDNGIWRRGTIAELYYRETSFPLNYNAPYRIISLQPWVDSAAAVEQEEEEVGSAVESVVGSEVVYVKEDNDRYVRKIGVRAIHETRYQSELDIKVNELSYVYCSNEFITNIYHILKQDKVFCLQLKRVYGIKLTLNMLYLYRILVLYPQRMTRTDTGYHTPTQDEVISGIKAYFDPTRMTSTPLTTTSSTTTEADLELREGLYDIFKKPSNIFDMLGSSDFELIHTKEAMMVQSFLSYVELYMVYEMEGIDIDIKTLLSNGFTTPIPTVYLSSTITNTISTVQGYSQLLSIYMMLL